MKVWIVWFILKAKGLYVPNELDEGPWQTHAEGLSHSHLLYPQNFVVVDSARLDSNPLPR